VIGSVLVEKDGCTDAGVAACCSTGVSVFVGGVWGVSCFGLAPVKTDKSGC